MAFACREFQLTCPICDRSFETRGVSSPSTIVRRGSDFHEQHRFGESPLPYLIHLCPGCGFCAEERAYEEIDPHGAFCVALRDFVAESLTPNIPWAQRYLADRYEHALKFACFADLSPEHIGDIALRGAWAASEEHDYEAARFFRRSAITHYTLALNHYDVIDRTQRAQVMYLVGELWRRLGDESAARVWFEAVPSAVVDQEKQQWIVALAERQRLTPKESM